MFVVVILGGVVFMAAGSQRISGFMRGEFLSVLKQCGHRVRILRVCFVVMARDLRSASANFCRPERAKGAPQQP